MSSLFNNLTTPRNNGYQAQDDVMSDLQKLAQAKEALRKQGGESSLSGSGAASSKRNGSSSGQLPFHSLSLLA